MALHGDKTQKQRDRALARFRDGEVRALVATDVAARGIHIDAVAGVIHFDTAADHKDYTHRSGRTARAGATGVVVTLVTPESRPLTAQVMRALKVPPTIDAADPSLIGPPTDFAAKPARTAEGAPPRARDAKARSTRPNGKKPPPGGKPRGSKPRRPPR